MIFKYGTESVGIDFLYTDTTPFFNRGATIKTDATLGGN